MPRSDRLLILLLASGALVAAPGSAWAASPSAPPHSTAAAGTHDATSFDLSDETADDPADEPNFDDPFCVDDLNELRAAPQTENAGVDPGELADDPADGAADDPGDASATPDDPSDDAEADPVDDPADGDALDFCDEPGSATAAVQSSSAPHTLVASLREVLRSGHLTVGSVSLPGAGTVTQQLALAPGKAPKALRSVRSARFAAGRLSVARARTVRVPLTLTKQGRKGLGKAGKEVRMTLRTTLRLRSGQHRTRTQVVVLRGAAKR